MVAAGAILTSLYSKLFHVTCVAHLLHNCARKVKSHFEDVDQLITIVKSAAIENKTRLTKLLLLVARLNLLSQDREAG